MTEKTSTKPELKDEVPPPEVLELHPIVAVVAKELSPGQGTEQFAPLAEDKFIELGAAVLHYVDDEDPKVELLHLVQSLAAFAMTLRDQHGSERLSDQIVDIVSQEAVIQNIQKLKVSADPEKIQKIAERFGDFSGAKVDKKAPKVGEAKPEGSVDINALNFPKRM